MDAIAYLQQQHRDVEQLFAKLKEDDALEIDKRRTLFLQLADILSAHAAIEEERFYPACLTDDTEDLLREAVEEHLSVKRLLADLLDMEPSDERFQAAITTLEEQVSHHVGEEETELMPKIRKALGDDVLAELGEELEVRFEELMNEEPHHRVFDELTEPAPI